MLTGKRKNITLHHIFKQVFGQYNMIENGVLLCDKAHSWLHSLERTDRELYTIMNDLLRLYKWCYENDYIEKWESEIYPQVREKIR